MGSTLAPLQGRNPDAALGRTLYFGWDGLPLLRTPLPHAGTQGVRIQYWIAQAVGIRVLAVWLLGEAFKGVYGCKDAGGELGVLTPRFASECRRFAAVQCRLRKTG